MVARASYIQLSRFPYVLFVLWASFPPVTLLFCLTSYMSVALEEARGKKSLIPNVTLLITSNRSNICNSHLLFVWLLFSLLSRQGQLTVLLSHSFSSFASPK
ncbi:hypothetical protein GGS20DRAFT_435766 [Poronia punctata]|nr:hypothetical protein GGS20DRAFT_435766 [Poronia punctata]